jgi:parallel beta-helix repeat protein
MPVPSSSSLSSSRRKPLAACVAAIFAFSAPAIYANSVFVTNCNDSGVGSLRAAVAAAADSDVVDATQLSGVCSTITLKTGDIAVTQNNLTIDGPGMMDLTISAKYEVLPNVHQYKNRILTHTGNGTLEVENLSVSRGYLASSSGADYGGCIYSASNVKLVSTGVYYCSAHAVFAVGGGVYAKGDVYLEYSVVSNNVAYGSGAFGSAGGGVSSLGNFTAKYSTISHNAASGAHGVGGGVSSGSQLRSASGGTDIQSTTISGNSASFQAGGVFVLGGAGITIKNSTISGNTANATGGVVGGIYIITTALLYLYNSTIAFNTANTASAGKSPGLAIEGSESPTVFLSSTMIASNTYGSPVTDNDFSAAGVTVSGKNNLILASSSSLPPDTIVGKCPILGPLKFNGGVTQTHALFSHSPVLDQGNNMFNLKEDQRGTLMATAPYHYPRVSGSAADIGAYELQQDEIIFDSNFEGCP